MKFLLLAVVSLAQLQRHTVQRGTRTQRRARPTFGRFGGHTDVARRDNLYQRDQHVGRYGGYTRHYQTGQNGAQGRFAGRRDPFRSDPNDARRGYNPYRDTRTQRTNQRNNGGADRMGVVCQQITAQTYERECGTYTGRMGCRTTCQRLRQTTGRGRYTRGRQTRGRTTGRRQFGRRTTGRRTGGILGRLTGRTRRTGRNFGRRTQLGQFGARGRTTQRRTTGRHTRGQIRIPTQGGVFGRRTRGRTAGRTQTRGRGRNGIFGNRLGQAGQNRATRHQI